MEHFMHIAHEEKERYFEKLPGAFTRFTPKETLKYALGATLYIPAVHEKLYDYLRYKKYTSLTTLVICLEDGIADEQVPLAEAHLREVCSKLNQDIAEGSLKEADLPLLFVRVRSCEQLEKFVEEKQLIKLITGFCLPKFNSLTGEKMLRMIKEASDTYEMPLYGMPIMETKEIIDLTTGMEELTALKDIIDRYKENVLNVRIGATDFTGIYGIRRNIDATIYDISVIRECIARIINVFGKAEDNYVISGPVWEFFSNHSRMLKPELRQTPFKKYGEEGATFRKMILNKAEDGLIKEIILDKVNGLCGKTIIHPSHICFVNALQVVTKEEYEDALQILGGNHYGVIKSKQANKMNEVKPHTNWARKIMGRAYIYGVIKEDEDYTCLF